MLASRRNGASVYALTENRSAHARLIIEQVCQQQGETFSRDPYIKSCFNDPIDIKVSSFTKAQVIGACDPSFLVLYLRSEASPDSKRNDGDTGTGVNAANTNPIRSSAIVNIGRDERGWMNAFWKPRFLLFFYFLPYIFSWGPRQFFKTLFKCYSSFFNCELYAEMTEHLGVKMSDCLQLEYLATQLGHFGKGYGKTLIEVFHEMADAQGKHVLLYSSSKKNVSFYQRHGYENFKNYGQDCTLMFRRYQDKN